MLAFGDLLIARRLKNPDFLAKKMQTMAPQIRQKFDDVVHLVGNPTAGVRYFRKSLVLSPTDCGGKPFDEEMRRKAKLSYDLNVPPEYQIPGAIDSMAAILNS